MKLSVSAEFSKRLITMSGCVVAMAMAMAQGAHAQDPAVQQPPWAEGLVKVDNLKLAQIRGGFSIGNGLEISFGIDRSVFVNGAPTAAASFNIASDGVATKGTLAPIVIQNGIDAQTIKAITTLTITANSIQVLKQANVQTLVGHGLAASLIR